MYFVDYDTIPPREPVSLPSLQALLTDVYFLTSKPTVKSDRMKIDHSHAFANIMQGDRLAVLR